MAYDEDKFYANNSVKIIVPKTADINLKFLTAILNSNLALFYYKLTIARALFSPQVRTFPQLGHARDHL